MPDAVTFARVFEELAGPLGPRPGTLRAAFDAIFSGAWTPVQIAGFAVALRLRGEDADTIAAAVEAMRAVMIPVDHGLPVVLDTCGTGGDGLGTLNVSTAAAIVVATAGLPVAKHGNRSVSSRTGSADVLEALGLPLDVPAARHAGILRGAGITFLFAPAHHPALRHSGPTRRELAVRTIFNALGPIANPARATHQLIGAYEDRLRSILAQTLARLGTRHAWVVRGEDGLDEVSPFGPTRVAELRRRSGVRARQRTPEDFGLAPAPAGALAGGDAADNAARLRPHPRRCGGSGRPAPWPSMPPPPSPSAARRRTPRACAPPPARRRRPSAPARRCARSTRGAPPPARRWLREGSMRIGFRYRRAGNLDRILIPKKAEVARMLAGPAFPPRRRPHDGLLAALSRGADTGRAPLRLIAEVKLRSPSAGDLSRVLTPAERALRYAAAGARMISVLTDAPFFGGSFADLGACREALDAALGAGRPFLLCKEFVIHPVQLDRALDAGADAVLLIVRILERGELPGLVRAAEARGLVPLVEVATDEELDRATAAGARLVGVNARDLNTLKMDAARAAGVLARIEPGVVAVHLSGLRSPEDVARIAAGRADAALIGEALMRQDDPTELLAAMVRAAGAGPA